MPLVLFMTNQFALRCSNTAFWNDFNIARDLMANFKVFRYNLIFYWLLVYFHWKQKIFMKWWLTFNLYSKKYFLSMSLLSYFFTQKFTIFITAHCYFSLISVRFRGNSKLGVLLLKFLTFYQKILWNIWSRLNSSTFRVFEPVFRYVSSKSSFFVQKASILTKHI